MKYTQSIRFKLVLRFSVIFVVLFTVILTVMFLSFRHLTLEASKENARSIAKTVRDGITSLMVLGVIHEREVFLAGLMDTDVLSDIKSIRVIRGEPVIKQFGAPREEEKASTSMEFEVLKTGEIQEQLVEFVRQPEYSLVIPYKASSKGRINCLNCHNVKEGEVLGAVSIKLDLTKQRNIGVTSILLMALLSCSSFIFIFWMLYRFFRPYTDFFEALKDGFDAMEKGQLGNKLVLNLNDEAGAVAIKFNKMQDTLSELFMEISKKVFVLVGYEFETTGNAIQDTMNNVDQLTKMYNFKRVIEEDSDKKSVYSRIQMAFLEMGLKNFLIYEMNFRKNTFELMVQGETPITDSLATEKNLTFETKQGNCFHVDRCDLPLFEELDQCRAKRTGEMVDSAQFTGICPRFQCNDKHAILHKCVPFFGASIGNLVQIAYEPEQQDLINKLIPHIKSYLHEASHILEVKTAMEYIRDQTLIDELTGLYNRRYLNESVSKLIGMTKDDMAIGVLMIDVDHFKRVNDECGHDAGDKVLKGISKIIRDSVRDTDMVIRFGGEEIVVLALNMVPDNIAAIAEKIRSQVEGATFYHSGGSLKKTISVGCAEFPTHSDDLWNCIKIADVAMYQAKATGRNKVVIFSGDKAEEENLEQTADVI